MTLGPLLESCSPSEDAAFPNGTSSLLH